MKGREEGGKAGVNTPRYEHRTIHIFLNPNPLFVCMHACMQVHVSVDFLGRNMVGLEWKGSIIFSVKESEVLTSLDYFDVNQWEIGGQHSYYILIVF
jgi:hypothetical protein